MGSLTPNIPPHPSQFAMPSQIFSPQSTNNNNNNNGSSCFSFNNHHNDNVHKLSQLELNKNDNNMNNDDDTNQDMVDTSLRRVPNKYHLVELPGIYQGVNSHNTA